MMIHLLFMVAAVWSAFLAPTVQAGEINGGDCFQGTYEDTTAWCKDNAKNCCNSDSACVWGASKPVTMCRDSCNGDSACSFENPETDTELFIGMGSCIGEAACQQFAGSSIDSGSCTASFACLQFAGKSVASGSCTAELSCYLGKGYACDGTCDVQGNWNWDATSTNDCLSDSKCAAAPVAAKTTTKAVNGDPHFATWSGRKFDFHGGCDLVLLQDPDFDNGQGIYIHIRTKIQRWWSYVESVIVQIGPDTLEVMGGAEEGNRQYFVNGRRGDQYDLETSRLMPFAIAGYPVRYRFLGKNSFQFKIFLEIDQSIVLKAVKDFMRVDVENPTEAAFGTSVGLMGSFKEGKMLARDGTTVLEDPVAFGKEWQVRTSEPMLFHNVEGVQHPQTCAMPNVAQSKRRRLEGSIGREQAELACAKVSVDEMEDCVFDVMATNDVDMVGAF